MVVGAAVLVIVDVGAGVGARVAEHCPSFHWPSCARRHHTTAVALKVSMLNEVLCVWGVAQLKIRIKDAAMNKQC